jgi:flagellar motor switch protein FliM
LPLFLRAVCEITLLSVEQTSFSDYQRGLPDPSPIFTVGMQPLNGLAAIQIHSSIAFPVIDRLLGGQGENLSETRQATEIEMKVLEEFINPVLDAWKEAWRPLIDLKMQIVGFETRPQMLQPVASNEIIVSIGLQVQIGDSNGSISLCLPMVMLEPVIEKFNQSSYSSTCETDPEQTAALLNKLSQVKFPASAQLNPAKISTGVLLSLTEGDVLRTNHHIEQPLQINYGGKIKFIGRLASRKNRVIIQIHEEND